MEITWATRMLMRLGPVASQTTSKLGNFASLPSESHFMHMIDAATSLQGQRIRSWVHDVLRSPISRFVSRVYCNNARGGGRVRPTTSLPWRRSPSV